MSRGGTVETLGEALEQWRSRKGLTQEAAASWFTSSQDRFKSPHQTTYSRWEEDINQPEPQYDKSLQEVLGLTEGRYALLLLRSRGRAERRRGI